ncbi:unnamed protein product [Brassica napus]|uniref:(rape) hypothetical protein n=1 Tax=Brassica napus TaxID=3708 RepID=A0A816V187_BRANA|nr:unnamed protein product [Brassica napus]
MCLSTETAELPMHVVTDEILTRLPAKSLMRFKCVSKLWLSLIRSRYFSNRFSKVPSPRLYMCLWDQATIGDNETYTLAPLDTRPSTSTFVVDDNLPDPAIGGYILQNLGGFMIYVYRREPHIYNPATGQLIGIPLRSSDHIVVPPGGEKVVTYYFGYDPLSHKYKAVSLISVFLEETKQVISSVNYIFSQKNKLGGISIDAIIYYLALVDRDRFVVVSFDIRSEEFNMIQVPKLHEDAPVDTPDLTLLELGGKATLCDPTNLRDKGVLALWTLEDVGSKKWSSKSLVLKPSQLPLVDSITFRVKGTTQNGKVFLIPKDFLSPFHILSYDMQNNDMRKIEIKGIPDVWFNMYEEADLHFDVMFMDQSESPIYIDFLSCFDWGDGD